MSNFRRNWPRAALIAGLLALAGCGFKPIYAVAENGAAPLNQRIAIGAVQAPEEIHLLIVGALADRIAVKNGEAVDYELTVNAKEIAERLAVQIDATVTRYNYRLNANYALLNLRTGETISGSANAVTSYNIVSSQYSTLFAERAAREKAARTLAEEIERALLLQLLDGPDTDGNDASASVENGSETTPEGTAQLPPEPDDEVIYIIEDR
jgi:LPS-assembly lipoprotein